MIYCLIFSHLTQAIEQLKLNFNLIMYMLCHYLFPNLIQISDNKLLEKINVASEHGTQSQKICTIWVRYILVTVYLVGNGQKAL